jgi:hypothetical protein
VSVVVNPVSVPEAHAGDSKAGSALLMEVRSFLKRFCSFPDEHALTAVTLWAAHAHMVRHFHTTPRLALISPEPGSGRREFWRFWISWCRRACFVCQRPQPQYFGRSRRGRSRSWLTNATPSLLAAAEMTQTRIFGHS